MRRSACGVAGSAPPSRRVCAVAVHRRPRAADKWPVDEGQLKIKGRKHWRWRAVDRDGVVLDILVQDWRDQHAAERFLRRVLEGEEQEPRVIVTDQLTSYVPALKRVLPTTEHRRHKGQGLEQSGGEFAPPRAYTGTGTAALQITRPRTELPGAVQRRL